MQWSGDEERGHIRGQTQLETPGAAGMEPESSWKWHEAQGGQADCPAHAPQERGRDSPVGASRGCKNCRRMRDFSGFEELLGNVVVDEET